VLHFGKKWNIEKLRGFLLIENASGGVELNEIAAQGTAQKRLALESIVER
jgi:hypothetical protein